MKFPIKVVSLVAILVVPLLSHAESPAPVTRAQVREELLQLEKAGYEPDIDADYPRPLMRAQAAIARRNNATDAYGPGTAGTTQSGK